MDDLSLHAKLTVKHICQGMQHDRIQYVLSLPEEKGPPMFLSFTIEPLASNSKQQT